MAFERYVLQKNNREYPVRDLLKKEDLDIIAVVELLNDLNIKYNDFEDNLKQVLVKEYKTTRWRDEYGTVRLELLTSLANQLNVELQMNNILFDLKESSLSVDDFKLLINNMINVKASVKGYTVRWDYDVLDDDIIKLTASLIKI